MILFFFQKKINETYQWKSLYFCIRVPVLRVPSENDAPRISPLITPATPVFTCTSLECLILWLWH